MNNKAYRHCDSTVSDYLNDVPVFYEPFRNRLTGSLNVKTRRFRFERCARGQYEFLLFQPRPKPRFFPVNARRISIRLGQLEQIRTAALDLLRPLMSAELRHSPNTQRSSPTEISCFRRFIWTVDICITPCDPRDPNV